MWCDEVLSPTHVPGRKTDSNLTIMASSSSSKESSPFNGRARARHHCSIQHIASSIGKSQAEETLCIWCRNAPNKAGDLSRYMAHGQRHESGIRDWTHHACTPPSCGRGRRPRCPPGCTLPLPHTSFLLYSPGDPHNFPPAHASPAIQLPPNTKRQTDNGLHQAYQIHTIHEGQPALCKLGERTYLLCWGQQRRA